MRFWFEDSESEVEGSDIYLKGRYKNFEASYYRHDDSVDGFDQPGFIPGTRFRSAPKIEQTVDIFAVKYKHDWDAKGLTFSGDVSFAQREGSRCAACHAAPQNPAFEETVDHGHQLIGDFRLGIRKFENHDILIGVEAREVDTGEHTDELLGPDETDSEVVYSYTKLAAYVQDQISLFSDRLLLTLGARYDGSNDLFDSAFSPRIALVYSPTEKLVLRGGWSTAFRFPNFSELYQDSMFLALENPAGFAIPIQVFNPNPDLEPEEIRTFDFGVEYRINDRVSAKLDLFYSEIKDFIVLTFNGGGPTLAGFENHPDDAELYGSELELRWRPLERFTGFVNWSWQEIDQKGGLESQRRTATRAGLLTRAQDQHRHLLRPLCGDPRRPGGRMARRAPRAELLELRRSHLDRGARRLHLRERPTELGRPDQDRQCRQGAALLRLRTQSARRRGTGDFPADRHDGRREHVLRYH